MGVHELRLRRFCLHDEAQAHPAPDHLLPTQPDLLLLEAQGSCAGLRHEDLPSSLRRGGSLEVLSGPTATGTVREPENHLAITRQAPSGAFSSPSF